MGLTMLVRIAAGAALVAMMWGTTAATILAATPASAGANGAQPHSIEFGSTLPPIGFVKLCSHNPEVCAGPSKPRNRVVANPANWQLLQEINGYVNGKIAPVSDKDLYGVAENWAFPVDAGDCEDYVLLKQRYLGRLGFDRNNLLITVVLDEKREGHAVLTVTTTDGDYVLDNRTNDIRRWDETPYVFLKRQSRQDPRKWVALIKDKVKNKPLTTSRG
jgi:predicted transglutaminase-like cysteine proteinase